LRFQQGEFVMVPQQGGVATATIFGLVNFQPLGDDFALVNPRRKIVVNVEMGRYVTSQIVPGATGQFTAGQVIFFNPAADAANGYPNGRFQNAAAPGTAIAVGIVTDAGPDAAGMIEFVGGGLFHLIRRVAVGI
jgi:hypothetical protein